MADGVALPGTEGDGDGVPDVIGELVGAELGVGDVLFAADGEVLGATDAEGA